MINFRRYCPGDYEKIMDFLTRLYLTNKDQQNWLPARWEYAEYLVSPLFQTRNYPDWTQSIGIWETAEGEIVGVANSENPDENVFLQVHPNYRGLTSRMLDWAESALAKVSEDKGRLIAVWVADSDRYLQETLKSRGYQPSESCEYLNVAELDRATGKVDLPEGYSIHSFQEGVDLAKRCECAAKAFSSTGLPLNVYNKLQQAPMYRPELDILTKYLGEEVTSFCTVWYDQRTNVGYFEPVGTHPGHQRKGLGRAVLLEGLQRLQKMRASRAYVGAWEDERRSFYESSGFVMYDALRPWHKKLTQ